ncbi:type I secretion system permease/ATPase [Bartonella sp. W8098]|uniref:type I secretion system permease/ATPase n=1 Tax=Bartonella TaxID=773 RepID=UPI0018DCF24A|nr:MULTISPECIES: type I secretion system permease/ATPase [Bartonella]MBH9987640.1 type I secretion system permease/ATPase [Bartonella apis]MBI0171352.1 type I secretion system permease/ATPase [Bartonella sp. W8151]
MSGSQTISNWLSFPLRKKTNKTNVEPPLQNRRTEDASTFQKNAREEEKKPLKQSATRPENNASRKPENQSPRKPEKGRDSSHKSSGRFEQADASSLISKWVDILLLAARQLDIPISDELVRNAAKWSGKKATEQSIIDVALASGLAATFVEVSASEISSVMLPAVIQVDSALGLLTGRDRNTAIVHFVADKTAFEKRIPFADIVKTEKIKLLLLERHLAVHDDRLDEYLQKKPKSWFKGLFVTNWPIFLQLGLGSLVGNMLAIGTSLFAMQVWDRVVPGRSTNTLWVLASGVALALLLEFVLKTTRVAVTDHFGKQADLKLSAMFFARVLNIRNDARPRSPGTLISQLRDLDQMRELLTSSTLGVLIDLPFVVSFLFIIWIIGGPVVLVPIAAIPFIVLPGVIAQYPLAKLSNEGLEESAMRNAILMESIYRAEDIKLLQAEPRFRRMWDEVNKVSSKISLKQREIASMLMNFSQTMQQIAYVGVVIAGVYGILDAKLSFGAVLACSILTSRTIAPLAQIPAILSKLQNARVGKRGLDGLLTLPVDHDTDKDYYHKPVLKGQYQMQDLVYLYGPQEKPALIVPRLNVRAGEKIAILGRVGAGKSTLLRLFAGLSAPVQGRVFLDDTPISMIDIADIRRDIGAMFQESSLFYGTLRDNLLAANPLATDEQLLEAMRLSSADQLLLNQPHGLDLKLRESGVGLSGGQKQTLMLARLFLRSPHIVLLDEPTASLDEATEMAVLDRMQSWLGNRTFIVATHRYPVLRLVDRIIVVDNGRIVRDGPKDEILGIHPINTVTPEGSSRPKQGA